MDLFGAWRGLDGIISAQRFAEQTAKNEERKAELQQKQEALKARQQDEKAEREAMQRFIENVRRFGKIEVLTKELLNTLIEKITVGDRAKTEAGYTQSAIQKTLENTMFSRVFAIGLQQGVVTENAL